MPNPKLVIDDYGHDEIQLKDFFTVPLYTRLKKTAKKSIWPLIIASLVSAAVAVTVAVVTGGLQIPGTGIIAAHQGVFYPLVKKIVIACMAAVSFAGTFFFSKWYIARKEAKKAEAFSNDMHRHINDDYYRDLTQPLRISNVRQFSITAYLHSEEKVMLHEAEGGTEIIMKKDACFIPLKTPRTLNVAGDTATHYRERDDYFRVLHANNTESDLSRAQMVALRDPSTANGTKASLHFLSRPSCMRRVRSTDQESTNASPKSNPAMV